MQAFPSNYLCQGFQNGSKVVDPNDGFGSNLVLSDDSTDTRGWIKPTAPTMHKKTGPVNPPKPLRKTGEVSTFQLGIGGSCGNDPMNGGLGSRHPPAIGAAMAAWVVHRSHLAAFHAGHEDFTSIKPSFPTLRTRTL